MWDYGEKVLLKNKERRERVFRKYDGERQYLGIKEAFTTYYSEFLFIRSHCSKVVKKLGYAYLDEVGF